MPTYVYRGVNSGTTFEIEQRITADPLTHHPETGEPVVRVIQAAGIVFKGSGFYKTDSRGPSSRGSSSSNGTEGGSSKASDGGDSGSSAAGESGSKSGEDFSAFTKRDTPSAD